MERTFRKPKGRLKLKKVDTWIAAVIFFSLSKQIKKPALDAVRPTKDEWKSEQLHSSVDRPKSSNESYAAPRHGFLGNEQTLAPVKNNLAQ